VQKGQLGTDTERRIIFIWEGAVAELPEKRAVKTMESLKGRLNLWDQALEYWDINEVTIKWMWAVLSRTNLRVDVCVTTRPAPFARAFARLCEHNNWPIRYVFAQSPRDLGRALPTMPDVDRVYYGRENQRWALGPKAVFFPQPGQIV
jgi:hypothetical protein